jgi:hypothetical protein
MRKTIGLALVFATVAVAGCLNENPASNDAAGSDPGAIPPAPKTAPFTAHEENTIVCIAPTANCQPGPDGVGHFSFPGTIEGDHIGSGTIASTSQVSFAVFPFAQTGQATVTTANGDLLHYEFEGTAFPGPGAGDIVFGGAFTFTGGTGRFATASGGGTYSGTANNIAAVGQYDLVGEISM